MARQGGGALVGTFVLVEVRVNLVFDLGAGSLTRGFRGFGPIPEFAGTPHGEGSNGQCLTTSQKSTSSPGKRNPGVKPCADEASRPRFCPCESESTATGSMRQTPRRPSHHNRHHRLASHCRRRGLDLHFHDHTGGAPRGR
jgi:hypothetical protein